jgi:transposase
MAKAITAGKHQNDGLDCRQMSDLVRVNWTPESYMAPSYIRDLRRILRYRNLLVRECTRMKNRGSEMLMECGVEYEKRKLHARKYFRELLGELPEKVGEAGQSVQMLLELNQDALELFSKYERQLLRGLELHPELNRRVTLLRSIGGVGPVLALTWALEVGEVGRLGSIRKAVSFCGLCSGEWSSAEKNYRRPISKKRNAHLQTVLIEAAHLARLRNVQLQQVYERELQKGADEKEAILEVARKLVAYLMAVDRSGKPFVVAEAEPVAAVDADQNGPGVRKVAVRWEYGAAAFGTKSRLPRCLHPPGKTRSCPGFAAFAPWTAPPLSQQIRLQEGKAAGGQLGGKSRPACVGGRTGR